MLKKSVGPVLIALIIAIVTLVKIIKTYGDFWQEAFDAPVAVVLLVLLNIVVGGIVIFILLKAISPKNRLAYAVVVALSISTFIAAPIAVSTFTGDEAAGEAESVKLSDLYNPLEKIVSEEIDEPVKETKREEIAALVARYDGKGKAGKALLEDRLDESLAAKGVASEQQASIKQAVTTTIDDTSRPFSQRLRSVAQLLFNDSHRDVVEDLART